jgi:formylglycine-generating enzyme required for sulfatase activity
MCFGRHSAVRRVAAACLVLFTIPVSHAILDGSPSAKRWVTIPAGRFHMGCVPGDAHCHANEQPRHAVEISRAFDLMALEVSVADFDSFAHASGTRPPRQPLWNVPTNRPVVNITWHDAQAVCRFLGGRLPTEAEWEYAARGGIADQIYPWGKDFASRFANATGRRTTGDLWRVTAPCGSFPPNGFSVFDMIGNVWEWTADWYAPRYPTESMRDPVSPAGGSARVIRGGSWDSTERRVRTSVRHFLPPDGRYNLYVGVRCARTRG